MSQMDPEVKRIGETEYTMYMLAPMVSHGLLMDVAKMVGPALGSALGALLGEATGGKQADLMEREVTPELLSGALSQLFRDVNKGTLESVIRAFSAKTHADGKPLEKIFDAHFMGKLDEMYQWLAWGMRVQWGKSLSALVSGAVGQGALAGLMALRSESPSTSTGSSGDQ